MHMHASICTFGLAVQQNLTVFANLAHALTHCMAVASCVVACRRRAKLEREAAEREQQIRAYQQEHWREMREAARRNRAAIMAEVGDPQPQQPQSQPQQQPSPDPARAGEQGEDSPDVFEFAAMVKDMQVGNREMHVTLVCTCSAAPHACIAQTAIHFAHMHTGMVK